jgi:hypothetical protein
MRVHRQHLVGLSRGGLVPVRMLAVGVDAVAKLHAQRAVSERSSVKNTFFMLREDGSAAPHQSLRDSVWMDFMILYGISDEELEALKRIHAYS